MTKLFALIAASLAITAGAASADGFSLNSVQDSDSIIELGVIDAPAGGTVEVYDFHMADQGRLLGLEDVKAGANNDVQVSLGTTASKSLLAVLRVGGQVVDQQVIRIDDNG
jgi:hypothetical protein